MNGTLILRTGWGEEKPVRFTTTGQPFERLTHLEELRERWWAAVKSSFDAAPGSAERAHLNLRALRLARLARRVWQRSRA